MNLAKLPAAAKDVLVLAVVYACGYGWFLAYSGFLPYVFDNNESFSAYIHGSNLYHFGLSKSFGLTDEAYGPDPAAHPYVYTHQGNFPRLFAFLLYSLGLRTVEAQIAFSTFTVGLGTVALIYVFFSRLSGRAYGIVAALLFMSDYVLFAQWQVNTFKVWHGFLLFSMLVFIQEFKSDRRNRWLWLLAAASLCVSYFDLLMAVFTFVFCGVYAAGIFARTEWRSLAMTLAAMFAGGFVSFAVLLSQLLGYYGWDGLRQDLYLTFMGRNYLADDPDAIAQWQQFFISHKIVFWEALVDSKPFASLAGAVGSVFQYGFAVFTPYLSFLVLALVGGPVIAALFRAASAERVLHPAVLAALILLLPALSVGGFGVAIALPFAALTLLGPVAGTRPLVRKRIFAMACLLAAWFAANLLATVICLTNAVEGHPVRIRLPVLGGTTGAIEFLLPIAVMAAAFFTWISWPEVRRKVEDQQEFTLYCARILAAGSYCMLLATYALGQHEFFKVPGYSLVAIWDYVLEPWSPSGSTKLFAMLVVVLVSVLILSGSRTTDFSNLRADSRLVVFFVAGAAAFLAAYFFSPGYMVLINLKRYTPILVFILIPFVALGVLALLKVVSRGLADSWTRVDRADQYLLWKNAASAAVAMLLLIHLTVFWIGLQAGYFELLPPDGARPFAKLDKPPYAGASFVTDSYAAPVAAKTGSWAYIDRRFVGSGEYVLDEDGYRPASRDIYKWSADRDDPKYRFPDFALCFSAPGFHDALRVLEIRRWNKTLRVSPAEIHRPDESGRRSEFLVYPSAYACDGAFLAQKVSGHNATRPEARLVDRDPSLLHRWSILKLEDDFPPYLARRGSSSAARVEVALRRRGGHCVATVNYQYRQQQGKPESGTIMQAWFKDDNRSSGSVPKTVYSGPAIREFRIPSGAGGSLFVSIVPSTATRKGETFGSGPRVVEGC